MKNPFIKSTFGKEELGFGFNINHWGDVKGLSFDLYLIFIEFYFMSPLPKSPKTLIVKFKIPFLWHGYYVLIKFKKRNGQQDKADI